MHIPYALVLIQSTQNEFSVISHNDVSIRCLPSTFEDDDFFFLYFHPKLFFWCVFKIKTSPENQYQSRSYLKYFQRISSLFHPFRNNVEREQSIIFQHHTHAHWHTHTHMLMGLLMHCQNICILQFAESIRVNGWMIVRGTPTTRPTNVLSDSKRTPVRRIHTHARAHNAHTPYHSDTYTPNDHLSTCFHKCETNW